MLTRDQIAKPIYEAIRMWQDGVMMDLPSWEEAVADSDESGPLSLAREAAEEIVDQIEAYVDDVRADEREAAYDRLRDGLA